MEAPPPSAPSAAKNTPKAPGGFRFEVDLHRLDWSQVHWRAALRRIPGMAGVLLVGLLCHQTAIAVLATATTFSVGMAGFRQVRGSRFLAMLVTTLVMALSALAGTLAGNSYAAVIIAAFIWGVGCGLLTVFSEDLGWIALQANIALLVATAFPSEGLNALLRAGGIFLGGMTQTLAILTWWRLEGINRFGPEKGGGDAVGPSPSIATVWAEFRHSLSFSSLAFRYSLRVGITLALAVAIEHDMQLKNGYWLPVTTAIILKPDFYRTYAGGVQRVVGTLAGVIAASVVTHLLRPEAFTLVLVVGTFGFLAITFLKASQVIFCAFLTSYVVFLIAVTGLPEASVTWHRLINTAFGCVLALVSRAIGSSLWRAEHRQ